MPRRRRRPDEVGPGLRGPQGPRGPRRLHPRRRQDARPPPRAPPTRWPPRASRPPCGTCGWSSRSTPRCSPTPPRHPAGGHRRGRLPRGRRRRGHRRRRSPSVGRRRRRRVRVLGVPVAVHPPRQARRHPGRPRPRRRRRRRRRSAPRSDRTARRRPAVAGRPIARSSGRPIPLGRGRATVRTTVGRRSGPLAALRRGRLARDATRPGPNCSGPGLSPWSPPADQGSPYDFRVSPVTWVIDRGAVDR